MDDSQTVGLNIHWMGEAVGKTGALTRHLPIRSGGYAFTDTSKLLVSDDSIFSIISNRCNVHKDTTQFSIFKGAYMLLEAELYHRDLQDQVDVLELQRDTIPKLSQHFLLDVGEIDKRAETLKKLQAQIKVILK